MLNGTGKNFEFLQNGRNENKKRNASLLKMKNRKAASKKNTINDRSNEMRKEKVFGKKAVLLNIKNGNENGIIITEI